MKIDWKYVFKVFFMGMAIYPIVSVAFSFFMIAVFSGQIGFEESLATNLAILAILLPFLYVLYFIFSKRQKEMDETIEKMKRMSDDGWIPSWEYKKLAYHATTSNGFRVSKYELPSANKIGNYILEMLKDENRFLPSEGITWEDADAREYGKKNKVLFLRIIVEDDENDKN